MKVFVTGGTRVLGQPAVRRLVEQGHTVRGLAHSAGSDDVLRRLGAEPVHGDLFDPASLRQAIGDAEAVLHMATRIPPTNKMKHAEAWAENDRIRIEGTRNLVDAALADSVQVFVYESVTLGYPDRGAAWIDAATTTPVKSGPPDSTLDAEAAVERFAAAGHRGISLRFGGLYGPTAPHIQDMLSYARKGIAPLFGPKDGYQSSTWVDDAATALVVAMERAPSGIYDVVDDEPLPRQDLIAAIAKAAGKKRLWQFPGFLTRLMVGSQVYEMLGRSQRVSNRRFKEATGWSPSVPNARIGWDRLSAQSTSPSETMKATRDRAPGTSSF
ncbi:MAG TPA: NAD(P)-dependent oxidoreductase [Thermomicrobiales bacterium]|nr:NAD(P)-dependent oxidoreductase [Thermomicrobiales bacterium]